MVEPIDVKRKLAGLEAMFWSIGCGAMVAGPAVGSLQAPQGAISQVSAAHD
jgi:hypothetical protein